MDVVRELMRLAASGVPVFVTEEGEQEIERIVRDRLREQQQQQPVEAAS